MYHLHPIVQQVSLDPQIQIDRADGRACSVDTNGIYKLTGERRAATPPLEHCDTPGSDVEREQLDQES